MLPSWDSQRGLRAKEILYRCMEELESTKAALFLEGSEGNLELVTSYGFGRRDSLPAAIKADHPLYDWVRRNRTAPAYLNDSSEAPPVRAFLEGAGTSRLLTIPLSVGSRLVGLVDARDKSRKAPFGPEDIIVAKSIAQAFESFLIEIGAYGKPAAAPLPAKPAAQAPPPQVAQSPLVAPPPQAAPPLRTESASSPHRWIIEELTGLLRVLSRLPGVAASALTVTDSRTVRALVLCTTPLDQQRRDALASHQSRTLLESGVRLPAANRWGWEEQDSAGVETRYEEVRTAVLYVGPPVWVVLSLVTPTGSPVAEAVFAAAARHLDLARMVRDYRRAARNLARVLLEPGETSFPHLRQHSQSTSELAQRMVAALHLPEDEEELVTVAAYLHDVGMRELDYARVYRMDRPGEQERRLYQRHPVVGARILEAAEFPGDLAGAIRSHHERWDGTGYPQRLAGRNIPLPSRIIHIAEVYDVLTSPSSYRRPATREAALEVIRSEAGKQFDPDLIPILAEVIRA
jgi:putative nucleotidyltransferase with HDIG domain